MCGRATASPGTQGAPSCPPCFALVLRASGRQAFPSSFFMTVLYVWPQGGPPRPVGMHCLDACLTHLAVAGRDSVVRLYSYD